MSIELALQENTAALKALFALFSKAGIPAPSAATPTPAPQAAAPVPVAKEEPIATPAEVSAAPAAKESAPTDALDYNKDVKPLLVKVSTAKGREALVGLLQKFGVAKGDQLPQDKLAAVVAEANTLLAA